MEAAKPVVVALLVFTLCLTVEDSFAAGENGELSDRSD